MGWDMPSRWTRSSHAIIAIALLMIPCILPGQAPSANAKQLQQHIAKAEQALRISDKSAAEHEYNEILKSIHKIARHGQAWEFCFMARAGRKKLFRPCRAHSKTTRVPSMRNSLLASVRRNCISARRRYPLFRNISTSSPPANCERIAGLALLGCAAGSEDPLPALRAAERLKQLYPGDADVPYESAELYTRMWNQSAGELMAKHPGFLSRASTGWRSVRGKERLRSSYSRVLSCPPEQSQTAPDALSNRSTLSAPGGRKKLTKRRWRSFAAKENSTRSLAVSDLAMADIEMHRHQLTRAKPLYQEAARLDPALTEARVGLAKILLEQHETDAAVRELLAIIAEHPEDAAAHYSLMRAYRDQKKIPEASAEMATFNRLQSEKADKFQNKMNALLNGKSTHLSTAAPVEESFPK